MRLLSSSFFAFFLLVLNLPCMAGTTAQLLHNPFQQPQIPEQYEQSKPSENKPVREEWSPQLRAIMRAGNRSMANIDGNIIRLGEKIDGFKLVEIHKRDVIFLKEGLKYHVSMDQSPEEEILE